MSVCSECYKTGAVLPLLITQSPLIADTDARCRIIGLPSSLDQREIRSHYGISAVVALVAACL